MMIYAYIFITYYIYEMIFHSLCRCAKRKHRQKRDVQARYSSAKQTDYGTCIGCGADAVLLELLSAD